MTGPPPWAGGRGGLLPWRTVARQSGADAAALAVGIVVVAVAAFLSAAVPLAAAETATTAVREAVAVPAQPVDVVVSVPLPRGSDPDIGAAATAATIGTLVEAGLPAELRSVLADPVTSIAGPELKAGFVAGREGLVRFSYVADAGGPTVSWVQGRPPGASGPASDLAGGTPPPVEVGLSQAGADVLGVRAGARLELASGRGGAVDVRVSGVYRAANPADPAWAVAPTLLEPRLVGGSAAFASIGLWLSPESLPFAQAAVFPDLMSRTYTYPVVASRLDAASAGLVATQARGLASGREAFEISGTRPVVNTGLDRVVGDVLAQVAAASAQSALLLLGVLALALLVEFVAAGLVVERRSTMIAQWRARGASLAAIGLAHGAEAAVLTGLGAAAGVTAASALTGAAPPAGWVLPPVLAALLPAPLLAVRAAVGAGRPPAPAADSRSLSPARLRRLAAEGTLAMLALAALASLVVRGVSASAGSVSADVVVLAAPVLVGLAAGVGLVRLQPRLAGLARGVAARSVGAVPLVAAARTRGSGPAITALVVAAAVTVIAASGAETADQGRLAAAWDVVGAEVAVSTPASRGLPPEIASLDGTDGLTVATASTLTGGQLLGQGVDRSVTVLAVDAEALGRLLALTPAPDAPVLGALAGDLTGLSVLAAGLPDWREATLRLDGDAVVVRQAGQAPPLPPQLVLGQQGTLVVDRAALARALGRELPAGTGWLVGPDAEARLRAAVGASDVHILARTEWLAAQAASPLPRALGWLFGWAAATAVGLAALAVVLMVASGSAQRRRAAARLRVIGTPRAAAVRVVWLESAVPAVVASLVGLAVGAGLAWLLVDALHLASVTGGRHPPQLVLAWWPLVLPSALGVVARTAAAVGAAQRREESLGALLRAG